MNNHTPTIGQLKRNGQIPRNIQPTKTKLGRNRYPGTGSTEGPKQDELKRTHSET